MSGPQSREADVRELAQVLTRTTALAAQVSAAQSRVQAAQQAMEAVQQEWRQADNALSEAQLRLMRKYPNSSEFQSVWRAAQAMSERS